MNSNLAKISKKYTKSNKHHPHCCHYFDIYDHHFHNMRNDNINLLEIGISTGDSLLMWKEYFPNANIIGIDIKMPNNLKNMLTRKNIKWYHGDGSNKTLLNNVIKEYKNFSIIIDDGSHFSDEQIRSFEILFPYLNNGGIYVIEDTYTSYWSTHVRGKEPAISFFKKFIDYMHFPAYRCKQWKDRADNFYQPGLPTYYEKYINSMHFYRGIIFIYKNPSNQFNDELEIIEE